MKKPAHPSNGDAGAPDARRARASAPAEPPITVVGIGASAGGLAALKTFFKHVAPDSGLAYVVVVHLSPDHESHLAELLQPHVRVPVQQVTETTPLAPNRVYVIPPGRNLSAVDTHLRLSALEEHRRERAPIDHFFRTLAATHDGASIGVILTGTGSDGTLGIKEIKGKNGLVVVQDPGEAEYDGMPQSAVATGLADLVLPLADIPNAVVRFARTEPRVAVPSDGEDAEGDERQLLQKVFVQVRMRTGRDFSHYKRSTLLRRIGRRMQLRHVEELADYVALLREEPEELQALADDLLITVTNFFRDPEVFAALAADVVPRLFDGKGAGDDLRVWSVGCATGEEAYSLAILLLEEAARRDVAPRLQLFASDLHAHSLERAREGFYPGDIDVDVSAERLARFFVREDGGYRIRKEVRELVVFAPHNLLSDPPFSKLDLVACRNVLIYLQRAVQHEIVELFHYALRPDGFLVLGTSEAVDGAERFGVVDKRRCLYRKRNVTAPEPRLPVFPLTRGPSAGQASRPERASELIAPGPLHQRLVERYAPPSLLVSPDDNVVHLSEHAGRYLVHPGGEPTTNVYRLVRDELRFELRSLLEGAREHRAARRSRPIPVQFDAERIAVVVHVRPAPDAAAEGFVLVIFDEREPAPAERPTSAPGAAAPGGAAESARARELEAELALLRHRLQSTIEEFETSQEELRASNEEFQSANEELRSTLEELETSKEELQSINEELQTVNQENRHRVEELRQLTGDLQNLLGATDIATLFLDRELRILRFTPRVADLFSVRPADRGRPLSDLTHRLRYPDLQRDARRVLETLVPIEHEVSGQAVSGDDARWYLARLLPYRTPEDRIEGVVLTFVDITTQRQAADALRASEARQAFLVRLGDALRPLTDLPAIEAAACQVVGEHLGADRAYYVTVDDARGVAVVARDYVRGGAPTLAGAHPLAAFSAVLEPQRAGRTLAVDDASADPRIGDADRAAYLSRALRAFVTVPLVKDGVLLACMSVTSASPRAWDAADVALVQEAAERTWDAVARASADAALAADLRGTQLLRDLGAQLSSESDPQVLYDAVMQAAIVLTGADAGTVQILDEPTRELMLLATAGVDEGMRSYFARVDAGSNTPCGIALATGARTVMDFDVPPEEDPDGSCRRHVEGGLLSAQSTPLITRGGQPIGMVSTHWRVHRRPTEHELRFLDLLARQAADLIERQQAAAALAASETRARTLVESLPGGAVFVVDRDLRYVTAEGEALHAAGFGPADFVGKTLREAVGDELAAGYEVLYGTALAGRSFAHEHEAHGRVFLSRGAPLRDADGRVAAALAVSYDITDRRRAEAALLASEARYRALFTTMDQGFCIVEKVATAAGAPSDFRYVAANPAFERHTGLRAPVGATIRELVPGVEASIVDSYDRVTETGQPERFESYVSALDLWIEAEVFQAEAPGQVAVLFSNVTERKRTEAALREGEARFRAVAETVPQIVWTSDDDRVTYYNPRWYAYTGWDPAAESAEGDWSTVVHPDDQALAMERSAEALRTGSTYTVEYRLRARDGSYRWHLARAARVPGSRTWVGAATDVHDQREALAEVERRVAERTGELAAANAQLAAENAGRARAQIDRDALLRGLAAAEEGERRRLARELHDEAGQHLTAVGLGLQALTAVVRPGSEVERRVHVLGELVASLGRELHDLAVRLRPRALDDFGLETALQAYVADWAQRSGIAADFHPSGVAERLDSAVESAVYRMVQEALTNISRHSGATRASVTVERRDGQLWVAVEDDGRGFDPEAAPRGDPAGGLGLLGIHERAALLGGTVDVESAPGVGSTVFLRIPLAARSDEEMARAPAPEQQSRSEPSE